MSLELLDAVKGYNCWAYLWGNIADGRANGLNQCPKAVNNLEFAGNCRLSSTGDDGRIEVCQDAKRMRLQEFAQRELPFLAVTTL